MWSVFSMQKLLLIYRDSLDISFLIFVWVLKSHFFHTAICVFSFCFFFVVFHYFLLSKTNKFMRKDSLQIETSIPKPFFGHKFFKRHKFFGPALHCCWIDSSHWNLTLRWWFFFAIVGISLTLDCADFRCVVRSAFYYLSDNCIKLAQFIKLVFAIICDSTCNYFIFPLSQ